MQLQPSYQGSAQRLGPKFKKKMSSFAVETRENKIDFEETTKTMLTNNLKYTNIAEHDQEDTLTPNRSNERPLPFQIAPPPASKPDKIHFTRRRSRSKIKIEVEDDDSFKINDSGQSKKEGDGADNTAYNTHGQVKWVQIQNDDVDGGKSASLKKSLSSKEAQTYSDKKKEKQAAQKPDKKTNMEQT